MQFEIKPFEIKLKGFPAKKGFLLEKEGRYSEVSPLPSRSIETYEDVLEQLQAVKKGWRGPLFPSVEFGLYGLIAPQVSSIPCALFLFGTPDEVLKTAETAHGCTVAKLKVGHWTVDEALAVIQALPFKLRLDFNHRWTPAHIHQLCAKLSPDKIEFLEDAGSSVSGFMQAQDEADFPTNLRSGLASSKSAELFDEMGPVFLKTRSQKATGERKQGQDREKIADNEEVKPRIEVTIWKPMIRGLPLPKKPLILSSSFESSIGLQQIASLIQSHQIPPHVLGIGTISNLEQDLVQNPAILKDGKLHFPTQWTLC